MGSQLKAFATMEKQTEQSALARQELLKAREDLQLHILYEQGYRLLNEIGHYFNGAWNYTVTISEGGQLVSFTLTEDQFISSLKEIHLSGFKMISSNTTILERMKELNIQKDYWNDSEKQKSYEDYTKIIEYAKDNMNIAQYNKGQQLEGFFAYINQHKKFSDLLSSISSRIDVLNNGTLQERSKRKLNNDIQKVIDEIAKQTNSRGFWTGGDTDKEGQIKGEGANIFKYSTIKNQLSQFVKMTQGIENKLNFSQLQEKLNAAKPRAKRNLEKKIDSLIDSLLVGFNATKISKERYQEIDAIIEDLI